MKRSLILAVVLALIAPLALPILPAAAQDSCGDAPSPRLMVDRHGLPLPGAVVEVYAAPEEGGALAGQLIPDRLFQVLAGPECRDGVWWWNIADGIDYYGNWIPESVNGAYVVEPYRFVPPTPAPIDVPLAEPVISDLAVPVPPVAPGGIPSDLAPAFAPWDWAALAEKAWQPAPDPLGLRLPDAYAGDFPVPPVNLSSVRFVQDANLNAAQLALLAQNGFVVVPSEYTQFDDAYATGWDHTEGKGDFITTDAILHSLFLTYQNALMFLEVNELYAQVANAVAGGYLAAEAQWRAAVGTPLEGPARSAALFYAVPLALLADGESSYVVGFNQVPGFREGDLVPSQVLAGADPALLAEAQPLVDLVRQAEGREKVPFLEDFEEDFSQYKPRSYYAGNPLLEAYFRAMMWLGRITFTVRSQTDTQAGLLVLRALVNGQNAYPNWQAVAETLTFLVGPVDDLSPADYLPLGEQVFGPGLPLEALGDAGRVDAFREGARALPGPRVNSIPLPVGIPAEQVDELTRGFRLFGQRFTFDGYLMQQLIYPEVGTAQNSRALPLGLDIPAVLGSDMAFALADAAGATSYEGYTEHVAKLREEVNSLDADAWNENLYGGWLWALQPLLVRDPAQVPPLMSTDAWKRKDISTALGSWTELKHATILYAEQPMGGLGGGGMVPPVVSTSIVEPNPAVFARLAIVAATLYRGLEARGYLDIELRGSTGLTSVGGALLDLAMLSARLAEIARKEIAGEPVTYDELYWMQESFQRELWYIRYQMEEWITNPPETVALVTDVASNASAGTILQVGIGDIDVIYVVANSADGPHLTRGAVYSYYEFENAIDARMTDDEWRALVAAGTQPPRPDWIDLYFSE